MNDDLHPFLKSLLNLSLGFVYPTVLLGNNSYNEGVWKLQYFVHNKIQREYVNHLQSHSKHFLSQPVYYRGLFEILN
jgi:hypothetical protein